MKNVGGRVSAPKTSFSLVACNKVKTQASGALNSRSFKDCAVHSQHKCSVEAQGAPTQRNYQLRKNYSNDGVNQDYREF